MLRQPAVTGRKFDSSESLGDGDGCVEMREDVGAEAGVLDEGERLGLSRRCDDGDAGSEASEVGLAALEGSFTRRRDRTSPLAR